MSIHASPECLDPRPRCNNRNEYGRCIALDESSVNCKFYCSIKDTKPSDYDFHIRGLRQKVEKELRLCGEIL